MKQFVDTSAFVVPQADGGVVLTTPTLAGTRSVRVAHDGSIVPGYELWLTQPPAELGLGDASYIYFGEPPVNGLPGTASCMLFYDYSDAVLEAQGGVFYASTGLKVGHLGTPLSGLLKATTGTVSAASAGTDYEAPIAAGTTAQYWRGDKSWQTLNQAAVAGLTTSSTPTFAGIKLNDAGALTLGTDNDATISHSGTYLLIDNGTGYTSFYNDATTAQASGQQRFISNYTPTSGTGASHVGNWFESVIDMTAVSWGTTVSSGNKFVASLNVDNPSPFPGLTYTGTEFVNNINGGFAGSAMWSGTGIRGVLYDVNYTGTWTTVAGFDFQPYVVDIDVTSTISGSHQIIGAGFYTTYNAANSVNQLYGVLSNVEAKGGVTVSGVFDAFYGSHSLASGGATLSSDAAVYRALSSSGMETYFNAQLASGKKLYGFFHHADNYNMASRDAVSFGSSLPLDNNNYLFRGLASVWLESDNGKAFFGAGKDLSIYHDGTHSYINNATGDLVVSGSYLKVSGGLKSAAGNAGATGGFLAASGETVTVENGIIVSIIAP